MGQYDILIAVDKEKYSDKLKVDDILNVVLFDVPRSWREYIQAAQLISYDNGSLLTLGYNQYAPEKLINPPLTDI